MQFHPAQGALWVRSRDDVWSGPEAQNKNHVHDYCSMLAFLHAKEISAARNFREIYCSNRSKFTSPKKTTVNLREASEPTWTSCFSQKWGTPTPMVYHQKHTHILMLGPDSGRTPFSTLPLENVVAALLEHQIMVRQHNSLPPVIFLARRRGTRESDSLTTRR